MLVCLARIRWDDSKLIHRSVFVRKLEFARVKSACMAIYESHLSSMFLISILYFRHCFLRSLGKTFLCFFRFRLHEGLHIALDGRSVLEQSRGKLHDLHEGLAGDSEKHTFLRGGQQESKGRPRFHG